MKYIVLISFFGLFFSTTLQGQDELRTTYPIDSCYYFMDPFGFKIKGISAGSGNLQIVTTLFRSSDAPDLYITGRGRMVIDQDSLPSGLILNINDTGSMLMTVPDPPEGSGNWPGGQPPFPLFLYGFLGQIGNTLIDPPLSMTMQVQWIFFEDTTQ